MNLFLLLVFIGIYYLYKFLRKKILALKHQKLYMPIFKWAILFAVIMNINFMVIRNSNLFTEEIYLAIYIISFFIITGSLLYFFILFSLALADLTFRQLLYLILAVLVIGAFDPSWWTIIPLIASLFIFMNSADMYMLFELDADLNQEPDLSKTIPRSKKAKKQELKLKKSEEEARKKQFKLKEARAKYLVGISTIGIYISIIVSNWISTTSFYERLLNILSGHPNKTRALPSALNHVIVIAGLRTVIAILLMLGYQFFLKKKIKSYISL